VMGNFTPVSAAMRERVFSMACLAVQLVLPESSRLSGASCAAGPRISSVQCFNPWELPLLP
jgi:hypothetical protein